MRLSHQVQTLGRGPGRSRSLTQDEAFDAMTCMLREDAAPEAVGALLMLLRMKGESADEIAGCAAAAQAGSAANSNGIPARKSPHSACAAARSGAGVSRYCGKRPGGLRHPTAL